MMRNTLFAATVVGVLCSVARSAGDDERPRVKSERFDRDPGWDGANHRTPNKSPAKVVEDFGYSPTRHARGKAVGEIGGKVVRSSRSAYYLISLEKPAMLNDPLHCSGQFVVMQTGGTSTFYLGWFNSRTIGNGAYPTESLRIRFNGGCQSRAAFRNFGQETCCSRQCSSGTPPNNRSVFSSGRPL